MEKLKLCLKDVDSILFFTCISMIPCVWLQFKLNVKDDGYHPSLSSILKKRPFCHEAEIAPQDQRFSHTLLRTYGKLSVCSSSTRNYDACRYTNTGTMVHGTGNECRSTHLEPLNLLHVFLLVVRNYYWCTSVPISYASLAGDFSLPTVERKVRETLCRAVTIDLAYATAFSFMHDIHVCM